MNSQLYILKDGEPQLCESVYEWGLWLETSRADRMVAETKIEDFRISTVFTGLDQQSLPDEPPMLYETMIFGGDFDRFQWRWATLKTAKEGHAAIVMALQLHDIRESEQD